VSVIAPTGTIALVMDCDTTGIEPDFALVKFKKLAGGGYFKIINRAVPEALPRARLWGSTDRRDRSYAVGHGSLGQRPASITRPSRPRVSARRRSSGSRRRCRPPSTSSSPSTNGPWRGILRDELGIEAQDLDSASFDLLATSALPARDRCRQYPCLRAPWTVEGAPHLSPSIMRCS